MVAQVKAFDSDSFLFQGFITTAMRMSSGAMFTPHNPVGQHSSGSYIFTFFGYLTLNLTCLYLI